MLETQSTKTRMKSYKRMPNRNNSKNNKRRSKK